MAAGLSNWRYLAALRDRFYGSLSGDMLGGPRVIFASSLDNNLPKLLGKVHPKYKTPHVAIIFFAIVVAVFALSGTFKYLAVAATGSLLLIDLGVSLAVMRLRQRDGLPKDSQFRLPFGPVSPLLSCAIVGWLLLQVPLDEAVTVAALIGACRSMQFVQSLAALRKELKHCEPWTSPASPWHYPGFSTALFAEKFGH